MTKGETGCLRKYAILWVLSYRDSVWQIKKRDSVYMSTYCHMKSDNIFLVGNSGYALQQHKRIKFENTCRAKLAFYFLRKWVETFPFFHDQWPSLELNYPKLENIFSSLKVSSNLQSLSCQKLWEYWVSKLFLQYSMFVCSTIINLISSQSNGVPN